MGHHLLPGRFEVHNAYGYPILHFVLTALFVAALVVLTVWLVTSMRRSPSGSVPAAPTPPADSAIQHARMRYARGEMTREEFLLVAADLGDAAPRIEPPPPSPA